MLNMLNNVFELISSRQRALRRKTGLCKKMSSIEHTVSNIIVSHSFLSRHNFMSDVACLTGHVSNAERNERISEEILRKL